MNPNAIRVVLDLLIRRKPAANFRLRLNRRAKPQPLPNILTAGPSRSAAKSTGYPSEKRRATGVLARDEAPYPALPSPGSQLAFHAVNYRMAPGNKLGGAGGKRSISRHTSDANPTNRHDPLALPPLQRVLVVASYRLCRFYRRLSHNHCGDTKIAIEATAQNTPASHGAQAVRNGRRSASAGSKNIIATSRK